MGGLACLSVAAVLLSTAPADAQDRKDLTDITVLGWSLNNWRLGVRVAPDYIGSDNYRLELSGSLNAARRGSEPSFGAPDDGVSLGFFGGRGWSVGASGRLRSKRGDDDDLRGFEKIDRAVEVGAFMNYWPNDQIRLRGELRHGFGGHTAWVANLGGDALWRQGALVLSVGPRLAWGDDEFVRTYFSVAPDEAARSPFGITPYAPMGSAMAAGVVASAERRMSRHWSVTAAASYRRLFGDAADSPIVVDLGSPDQFSTTLGVRYILGK
jgi:outer membrane protein